MSARIINIVDLLDASFTAIMVKGLVAGTHIISEAEYNKLKDKTAIAKIFADNKLDVAKVVVDSGKGKNSAEQLRRIKEYGVEKEVAEISATVAKIREKCGSALVFYFK